ncbi:MAG TPA: YdbH domain-containing protein, partial [Candidatus Binatia bacterium]|nr:YdbH domain-containing protein [Candidatus Binatia bacterium]
AGLRFSGSLPSPLPGIVLTFQGRYDPEQAGKKLQADFRLPQVVLPPKTSLQPLHPLLQGMSGGGSFQAEGQLWAGTDQVGGSAVLKIAAAEFSLPKQGLALRGVSTEIRLDRLFDLVTAPSQRIEFRDLHWQDMLFSNGELVFSNGSDGSLSIASGGFDWCQGRITLAPLRIKPGASDFLMTFTFDRVNFAQMLNALVGKTIVSGDAEMNGIVPIRMFEGSPIFLDGHLFSTPGIGGNLKVSQPELIANGQVLVEEAIRDFRYNWIKVNLGGHNDRLDMVVSIDGAPARKLPLRYDAKLKDFVRDPEGGRHVELKGLLLDIRFLDIDLKDLLKAGSQMTSSYQEK